MDSNDLYDHKLQAIKIAEQEYSSVAVKHKWDLLISRLGL
jgi:hypothetical protein